VSRFFGAISFIINVFKINIKMKNSKNKWLVLILIISSSIHAQVKEVADKIYTNGKIITVDSKNSIVQAVAVKNGKIIGTGSNEVVQKLKGKITEIIDLAGKTVVPGFVDGHSHFMSFGHNNTANLNPAPVGKIKKIADIVEELQSFQKKKGLKEGDWIRGFGYDVDQLQEKRHPNKEDLDKAFPNTPVTITHVSGHMSVANSAALKLAGIDANTKDIDGGVIERKKDSKEPTGLFQEKAQGLIRVSLGEIEKNSLEDRIAQLKEQQLYYASFGVTTAQDGSTSFESLELLREAAKRGDLFIDIEALPSYGIVDKVIGNPNYHYDTLENHFKINGFKFVSDGSPQGKTAFFTQSYLTEVPGCDHTQCNGFPVTTQEQFNEAILKAFKNKIQPFVHCNGDAAIDMYIAAVENANKVLGTTNNERRPVVIHSQFARPDQLDKYKELGFVPSFFSNHAFFWGDVHEKNLGYERAKFLSPLKTAINKKIIATNHTDFGVTPINQLFLLWTSVERKSRSGKVIGPDERLTPLEGLRAITINGAYEYFEENSKGSIENGKLADLVILSDDLTAIDPSKIKDIVVLETIKEGKTIFKK
jgi:predicted amidohydrolase YtcJ